MIFEKKNLFWIREADQSDVTDDRIIIYTQPKTDLWQRTYYGFQNDSAPVLQMKTSEKYFSFIVKTEFDTKARFDQCGIVVYLDSENWMKASIEYENEQYQRLGSVVTNHGYSDWATTDIDASVKSIWYRLSRRESDYCIECSTDGTTFQQMWICHLWEGNEEISFGVYACSPAEGSFQAKFTNMQITECMWEAHK